MVYRYDPCSPCCVAQNCAGCSWPFVWEVEVSGLSGGGGPERINFDVCNGTWHAQHENAFAGPLSWNWPGNGDSFFNSPPCNGIVIPNPVSRCVAAVGTTFQYETYGGGLTCNPTGFSTVAVNDALYGVTDGFPPGTWQILKSCPATSTNGQPCFTASIGCTTIKPDPTNYYPYDLFVCSAVFGPVLASQIQCLRPIVMPLLWAANA